MEWIQPSLLWGLLGIAVPILIHLWNGKRGKVIAWAATAWLNPKEAQSSRSIRLEQRLLLLLRVLLWMAIVSLLAGLFWRGLESTKTAQIVHLVFPQEQLSSEFRFELEQASQKGETVFWLTEDLPAYAEGRIPELKFEPKKLQNYFDQIDREVDSIHIYAQGTQLEFTQAAYWLPQLPQFHLSEIEVSPSDDYVFDLDSTGFLGFDKEGVLRKMNGEIQSKRKLKSIIPVYFYPMESEKTTNLKAALKAIEEVYGLTFAERDSIAATFLFSENLRPIASNKFLFITGNQFNRLNDQSFTLSHSGTLTWEELLKKGVLPERILDPMIRHLAGAQQELKISKNQLSEKFYRIPQNQQAKLANTHELLLVLIVILLGLERFLSFRKNL